MSYEKARALLNKSVSRPTLYSVAIPRGDSQIQEYIKLYCTEVTIPTLDHTTVNANGHENLGVIRVQPTSIRHGGRLSMTLIENSEFEVYNFFRALYDESASEGSNPIDFNPSMTQRMSYRDDFKFDFSIFKLENPGQDDIREFKQIRSPGVDQGYVPTQRFDFKNSYVTAISSIPLNSAASNTFLRLQVNIAYEVYSTSGINGPGSISIPFLNNLSPLFDINLGLDLPFSF